MQSIILLIASFFVLVVVGDESCPSSRQASYGCSDGIFILRPLIGEVIYSHEINITLAVHSSLKSSTIILVVDDMPMARWPASQSHSISLSLPSGRHSVRARSVLLLSDSSSSSSSSLDGEGEEELFATEETIFWVKDSSSRSSSKNGDVDEEQQLQSNANQASKSDENQQERPSVVFGVEHNLRKGEIRSFAGSFRATGSRAEMILWTSGRRAELEEVARIFDIQLIDYDFWQLNRTYGPVGDHRFHLFREFLDGEGKDRFSNILVTDVRDVMFQLDPFEHIPFGNGVATFQEAEYLPIHKSWTNVHWLTDNCTVYKNEKTLEKIQHNKRSCSGVTIGTAHGMYHYIKTMEEELQRTSDAVFDAEGNVIARGWCADQAVHQTVFYTNMLEKKGVEVTLHSNEYGPLLTIGDVLFYNMSDSGDVINWAGEVVAMVHQFDRHQPLREAMQNMYWDDEEREEYQRRYPKYRGHGEATEEDEKKWQQEQEKEKTPGR